MGDVFQNSDFSSCVMVHTFNPCTQAEFRVTLDYIEIPCFGEWVAFSMSHTRFLDMSPT